MAKKKSNMSAKLGRGKSANGNALPIFGAIVALGLLGFGFYSMSATKTEMAIDPETFCPAAGAVASTIILFDVTDPLAPAQSKQLQQYLEREFTAAAVGTQFTMGIVSEDDAQWGATAPLCKPPSPDDVSALTQNVTLVKERYDERFLAPMHSNLADMITATGSSRSPIMEALQSLAAETPGFLTFSGPRKVILISDLLQHSDAMSFYKGNDWESFANSADFERLGRTLSGAKVEIFSVPRKVEGIRDPAMVEDFWMRYFDLQGADLPVLRTLGDL